MAILKSPDKTIEDVCHVRPTRGYLPIYTQLSWIRNHVGDDMCAKQSESDFLILDRPSRPKASYAIIAGVFFLALYLVTLYMLVWLEQTKNRPVEEKGSDEMQLEEGRKINEDNGGSTGEESANSNEKVGSQSSLTGSKTESRSSLNESKSGSQSNLKESESQSLSSLKKSKSGKKSSQRSNRSQLNPKLGLKQNRVERLSSTKEGRLKRPNDGRNQNGKKGGERGSRGETKESVEKIGPASKEHSSESSRENKSEETLELKSSKSRINLI